MDGYVDEFPFFVFCFSPEIEREFECSSTESWTVESLKVGAWQDGRKRGKECKLRGGCRRRGGGA
jgi:hypothetical protein